MLRPRGRACTLDRHMRGFTTRNMPAQFDALLSTRRATDQGQALQIA